MPKKQPFADAVRLVLRDLRRGEVVSYGEVARRAGHPRAARAVGNVLARGTGLPWWRVVRASGELVAHSRVEQARRLRREGVTVREGAVEVGTRLERNRAPSRRRRRDGIQVQSGSVTGRRIY